MKQLTDTELLTKTTTLLTNLATIVMPPECLKDFDVTGIIDAKEKWVIELREKEDRVPTALTGKEVVNDGFCTPVDVLTHAFSLKRIYLRFYRRRWKERGSTQHYSNTYDLHLPGMRTTKALGDFLKEFAR